MMTRSTDRPFDPRPPESNRRALAKNAIFSFAGGAATLPAAIIALPILLAALGTERLGILMLVWLIVGYLGLFDLGLGRALTKLAADRLASGAQDTGALLWSATAVLTALGVVLGAALALFANWIVAAVRVPPALTAEAVQTCWLLALSVPFIMTASGLRGFLEAQQRFVELSTVRVGQGLLFYLAPLAVLPYSHALPAVVATLVATRVLAWMILLMLALRGGIAPPGAIGVRMTLVRELVRFGRWVAVSTVVGPLMLYADRFLIGTMVSVAAVAYYATPYEVVTKLWLIPAALTAVLFPAFATYHRRNPAELYVLAIAGIKWIFLAVYPLVLVIIAFAPEGLELWLGKDFADNAAAVLRIIAAGVLVNCVAYVPYSLLQAVGRPELCAKLHLIELPAYLICAYLLIDAWGIKGAALAWTLRAGADCAALLWLARDFLRASDDTARRLFRLASAMIFIVLPPTILLDSLLYKAAFVAVVSILLTGIALRLVLTSGERDFVRRLIAWRD
jgi:O-antigen/teichoic acid export membrane protein